MPVKIGPSCEGPFVHGAQKKAWDRVCHDPESTADGEEPTNERRFGLKNDFIVMAD